MKRFLLVSLCSLMTMTALYSQVMVTKMLGKKANESSLGFGVFAFYDFPLKDVENQSIRIELMDLAFFPYKSDTSTVPIGYLSIKLGYKYIFSETKTGLYIEPQAGYCRVVSNDPSNYSTQTSYGDGVALAMEVGYTFEVGQRGHVINFGLKYEYDMAGAANTISSIGLRASYQFNLFQKRDD